MNWKKYDGTLEVGDIIEISSKVPSNNKFFPDLVVTFVKHYGIIVKENNEIKVLHNPFGGKPIIESKEKVFTNRTPDRILKTGLSNEEILRRYEGCKNNSYDFWEFNCEDFVSEICKCNIGKDQRVYYFGSTAVVIIVLSITGLIIYLFKTKK